MTVDEEHDLLYPLSMFRLARRTPPLSYETMEGSEMPQPYCDLLVHDGDMMAFFSDVLSRLADSGIAIETCYTNGRAWSDNDTLADLGVTRESVYPRIREARQQHQTKANSHS